MSKSEEHVRKGEEHGCGKHYPAYGSVVRSYDETYRTKYNAAYDREIYEHKIALDFRQSYLVGQYQCEQYEREHGHCNKEKRRFAYRGINEEQYHIHYVTYEEYRRAESIEKSEIIFVVLKKSVEAEKYIAYRAEYKRAQYEYAVLRCLGLLYIA